MQHGTRASSCCLSGQLPLPKCCIHPSAEVELNLLHVPRLRMGELGGAPTGAPGHSAWPCVCTKGGRIYCKKGLWICPCRRNSNCLQNAPLTIMMPLDSMQVSNWTGDARQLLDVAQQAIEQSQEEATEFKDSEDMAGPGRNTGAVAFRHAGKALSKIQTLCGAEGAKSMISSLTSGQLTVLCAAARLTVGWESGASHTKQMNRKRTRNNWTLKEIFDVYATLTKRAQVPSLSHPEFFVVCSILDDMACLRLGPRKNVEWLRKAQLKVTVADIAEVVQGNSFYQRMLGLTE
mmetsp:Transcript_28794/g.68714  ORF Transcript_28794/g.68714 Transcript_28794/m.68714 type:complete len:291 (-) Transcript_28794:42-914(-)